MNSSNEAILLCPLKQFTVAGAAPTHLLSGGNIVADQCVANLNPARTSRAESSCRKFQLNLLLPVAEDCQDLFAGDGGKSFEVIIQSLPVREAFKQRLDRPARATKHRFATEDSRIADDQPACSFVDFGGRFHGGTLAQSQP